MDLIIGSHVSFNNSTQLLGSVKEAISYGANTFMFYTGAPQNTKRSEIKDELILKGYTLPNNRLPMIEVVNKLKININYLEKMAKENL